MIETTQAPAPLPVSGGMRCVFKKMDDDRTAGTIAVWERVPAADAAKKLNAIEPAAGKDSDFSSALSEAQNEDAEQDDSFGFGDLIDIINPLQHIPLVSALYREVTGDDIKPVSRVLGDTVFGGPVGGAVSIANVVVEHETGRDIAGNVLALATGEKMEKIPRAVADNPEDRLSNAVMLAQNRDEFPGSAIAFADLSGGARHAAEAVTRPPKMVWKLND